MSAYTLGCLSIAYRMQSDWAEYDSGQEVSKVMGSWDARGVSINGSGDTSMGVS